MPGASYLTPSYGGPISGAFGGQVVAGEVLWNANGSATDLRVAGYFEAHLNGTDGIQQFGDVLHSIADDNPFAGHPVVWNGTAASATFLDETGLLGRARIYGAGGGQFVGTGNTIAHGLTGSRALLWNSLTATVIDITPTNLVGFYSCIADGTSGTQQVGSGFTGADGSARTHALLWTGSADSAVDLSPSILAGYYGSSAVATDGLQQVGDAEVQGTSYTHALLWSGTAASVVDLNPSGFGGSVAAAVANGKQVGYGHVAQDDDVPWNALLWSGTAGSAVNLHQFLTAEFNAVACLRHRRRRPRVRRCVQLLPAAMARDRMDARSRAGDGRAGDGGIAGAGVVAAPPGLPTLQVNVGWVRRGAGTHPFRVCRTMGSLRHSC